VSIPGTIIEPPILDDLRAREIVEASSLVALVDVDDFIVTRLSRGERWAATQIQRVAEIIERERQQTDLAGAVHALEPDEWIVLLRSRNQTELLTSGTSFAEGLLQAVAAETPVTVTVSLGTVESGADQTERSLTAAVAANQRKLVLGGNRVIVGAGQDHSATPEKPSPERIELELSQKLREGDHRGVVKLLKEWISKSAELEGVTPEMLRSWLAAEILFAMNVVERHRLPDGSLDWVETFGRTSFDELMAMASIHEQSYLALWLERLVRRIIDQSADRPNSSRHILALVESYIQEHYAENLSLTKVARSVFVSPFYISHLFHRELNTTFLKYLTAIRIAKARELLLGTSLPVSAIAALVGYATPKHFRSVFKRTVGMTPSEYRRTEAVSG
jgi:AraC-like DNA-binding protein/GGDEF domain-containing protein